MKGKWAWFSGDSVERLDFWETGLVFLGDNFDWRLAWRGDELYGVSVPLGLQIVYGKCQN